ncbi:hypothetical protein Tco_0073109 [Tanacetum coccineum]
MSNTNNNMQPQTSSVLQNDTTSLCSTSKVQEKTQLSRSSSPSERLQYSNTGYVKKYVAERTTSKGQRHWTDQQCKMTCRSGNDTDADDADIRPIYDEEPIVRSMRYEEVNSHAKIHSYKTRNSNKPVDQKSHTQKPGRQIFIGHRFSPNKTSHVYEKTSPRSDLRWKPTSRIFKSVGLRWIPTGKLFDSYTSKVDSEPHMVQM